MKIPAIAPTFSEALGQSTVPIRDTFANPAYEGILATCDSGYRHWDKVRRIARDAGLDPMAVWARLKLQRSGMRWTLPLRSAQGVPLSYTIPDVVQREFAGCDRDLSGRVLLDEDIARGGSTAERYIVSSLREEAIASSMLEGAATTRREAKRMLARNRAPRTRGERMIVNNYRAISFIRDNTDTPMSPEFLRELQEIITRDTLDDASESGRFRTPDDDVAVTDPYGEVLHTPPPASDLAARIDAFCRFANGETDGDRFVHPIARATAMHFQLGYDHPFCDGNGRTARALFYWSMLREGYWVFEYLPISRLIYAGPSKYGRAFLYTETDEFDLTYFLVYTARVLGRARHDLRSYLRRKQHTTAAVSRLFADDERLNHRQRDLLARFLKDPGRVTDIKAHQGRHNVVYATARADLLALADWGYLVQHRSGKRYSFSAGPRLESHEDD